MPGPGSAGRRSAARRRGSFIFSRKIHATAAGSTAASARRIPSTSVVIPGAEPAFAARLSPPPQSLVHARLEPAGPEKGAQPARRRADLRSRRRGRPGGQGGGAVGRRGSARCRRLRPARAGAAGQCARYSVGSGRSRRRGRDANRCGAVAKGRERQPGSAHGIGARCGWRVIDPRDLVHVGDAARRPRCAGAIAAASPRLAALVAGTSDLAKDLHALHTPDRLPLLPSLGLILLAARAHGLAAFDGVHLDLADDEGFAFACRQGRALGFDGKTLIHPKQIEAANAAFAPGREEIAWARRVIAAHAEAEARGTGVVLGGRPARRKSACRGCAPPARNRRGDRPDRGDIRPSRRGQWRQGLGRRAEPPLTHLPARGLSHPPRGARGATFAKDAMPPLSQNLLVGTSMSGPAPVKGMLGKRLRAKALG